MTFCASRLFDAAKCGRTPGTFRLTYRELREQSEHWAAQLPSRAVVFILCANRLEPVVAYVGALNTGIVPLLLDARIDPSSLARLVSAYDPTAVYAPGEGGEYRLERRKIGPDRVHDDLALLLTTSGSTGSPKLVRISHDNLLDNFRQALRCLPYGPDDRAITTLPMNYTYGLSLINLHLSVGGSVLLTERMVFDGGFWSFLQVAGATNMAGVPRLYELMFSIGFETFELPTLRLLSVAGGKISEDLHRQLSTYVRQTGRQLIEMYGQCEATTYSGFLPSAESDRIGVMGYALPGGRFSLVDDAGCEIQEVGKEGELVYEGANVALGYAESAGDLVRGDEFHGRLMTGDLARRDATGCYTVTGRSKRFLKIFGNRISLDDVERLLGDLLEDGEGIATGTDDRLCVFITGTQSLEAVRNLLSQRMRIHPLAVEVRKIDFVPRNASGKVLYGEVSK